MASGILYPMLRPFAKVAIAIYFKKLHITGREHIPAKGPLIIACNHPNSFAEPCILATYQSRRLHFIVRGDVFKNPIIAWLLRQTNQIPIFRVRDGFKGIKRNDATFRFCYQKLQEGEAILIFSEGLCISEKRLRPIQKGTARMALGTIEEYGSLNQFHILPVGVTYTHGDQIRSEVMINIGKPLLMSDYIDLHTADPSSATQQLTQDIESAIKPLMIHLEQKGRDMLYDDLMDLMEAYNSWGDWPIVEANGTRFAMEKQLELRINAMPEATFLSVKQDIQMLKEQLNKAGLSINSFMPNFHPNIISAFYIILGWPIGLFGWLINLVPYYSAKWFAERFRKEIEFYTPVRMATLLIVGLLQMIILLLVGLIVHPMWLLVIPLMPILGLFSFIYYQNISRWIHFIKLNFLKEKSEILFKAQQLYESNIELNT
jgi:glycerol-3-phosphate O-acyltransferase/dihydroxyacetone phosphate acyltransferase